MANDKYAIAADLEAQFTKALSTSEQQINQATGMFAKIVSDLNQMEIDYQQWKTKVDEFYANQPANPSAQNLKSSSDLLFAELAEDRIDAQAYQTAIDGV